MAEQSIYTRRLGSAVARNAKRKDILKYHVIRSYSARWSVVMEGSDRAMRTFDTKGQAISFARQQALEKHAREVIVHGADGSILSEFKVS